MINIKRYVDINSASSSASSSSSSGSCSDCASQTDFNNFKDLVNKQFYIVDDEITELNAEQVLQEAEIKQLQIQIKQLGGGHYGFASYADAAAATLPVNSVVEVYGDHGTHTDPVSGATVSNSGMFIVVDKGLQFVMGETITDIEKGYTTKNGNDEAEITPGLVIYYDGTEKTGLGNWSAYFLKVKKDDVITYSGTVGSSQEGEVIMYIGQLDSDKNFIAPLAEYTSTGSQTDTATLVGTATQDGYAYVRIRVSGVAVSYTLLHYAKTFLMESDIDIAGGVASYESVENIYNNKYLQDVTDAEWVEYVDSLVIYSDGTTTTSAGDFKAAFFPVKSGDDIYFNGILGSTKSGEVIMYIGQMDSDKKFVKSIGEYTSTGVNNVNGVVTAKATQDGYAYVRVRDSLNGVAQKWVIKSTIPLFENYFQYYDSNKRIKALEDNLASEDVTNLNSTDYVTGLVIYYDGTQTTAAGSNWLAAFVPVKAGDSVTYNGNIGSSKAGEIIMYIGQCGSDKNFIKPLATYTSTGNNAVIGSVSGTAVQDGYVYVRVRAVNPIIPDLTYSIEKNGARFALQDDLFSLSKEVYFLNNKLANVFEAPYHNDLSSLTERNPSFAGMDSPLNYTFMKQWARRDWYNTADSFMLSKMSLDENPWNSQSNIYDITPGNVFSYAWSLGEVKFSNPTANGRIVMFADRYTTIGVCELAISKIAGNATIGIMFADVDQSNSISVRVSNDTVTCETYVDGKLSNSTTFAGSDMSGSVLRVQHTGTALILTKLYSDGSWDWLGRYDHYSYLDGRKLDYIDTWKTYVFAQTDDYTNFDFASFTGFSNRISSGANSVSIRFLTYEDGTFIQRGNWLYYLVEGTGTTIGDLFTQIVRLNLNSGEVQMVGVILQVRTDGTDEDIVLSDDSIKAVYDRNSKTWKGVSCGMEYDGKGGGRPKLYFETKQDIMQGGIVLIKNSVQMKNADGSFFGTDGSAYGYGEDIDFFYDSDNKEWVLTANTISSGCKTYRSPTLYDKITLEYTTAEVPSGVRDTGNQFVKFDSATYLTSGGSANKLHLRSYEKDLPYLGELKQDVYLDSKTIGPWCTLVPYTNGDETSMYLLSFDRSDLYEGKTGAGTYDHGGLYCWKAVKTSS